MGPAIRAIPVLAWDVPVFVLVNWAVASALAGAVSTSWPMPCDPAVLYS
jgi:hypothetical protein